MFLNSKLLNPKKIYSAVLRRIFGTITHVATTEHVIALTFDDGPHPDTTPQLLEILERHNAHATFFMLGESAKRYPLLVKQVAQAGHAVCNHSWDHPSFPYISARERRAQIRKCRQALAPYGRRLFRPPYGDMTLRSRLDALLMRHRVVTWNVASNDWINHEPQWFVEHLGKKMSPGSIVLLHDTLFQTAGDDFNGNRINVFKGLDRLLQRLKTTYQFVTVPDLFTYGRPQKRLWSKTSDMAWLNGLKQQTGHPRQYPNSPEKASR